MVQFAGMSTAAGPPARTAGIGAGRALVDDSIFAAMKRMVGSNVEVISRDKVERSVVWLIFDGVAVIVMEGRIFEIAEPFCK